MLPACSANTVVSLYCAFCDFAVLYCYHSVPCHLNNVIVTYQVINILLRVHAAKYTESLYLLGRLLISSYSLIAEKTRVRSFRAAI